MTDFAKVSDRVRVHLETGVEIVKVPAHRKYGERVGLRWEVRHPTREGSRRSWTAKTLGHAIGMAEIHNIPGMRDRIATAWSEAHAMDAEATR